jgi:hypothetical protein
MKTDKKQSESSVKKRHCLNCNTFFTSQGPGNRICGECNSNNDKLYIRNTSKSIPHGSSIYTYYKSYGKEEVI